MKNSKGITLISLVITIIVLLILISVGTTSGIGVLKSSKLTAFTTELKVMQTKVNEIYQKYKDGDTIKIGENLYTGNDILTIGEELSTKQAQVDKVFKADASGITKTDGYRYWSIDLIKDLGIEGVKQDFFINVKKRSIVSYEGFKYNNEIYYTLEQIPNSLYNVEYTNPNEQGPTFDIKTEKLTKSKWRITIENIQYSNDLGYINKWQVRYGLKQEKTVQWYSTEDMSFVVNKEGTYQIQIFNEDIESEIQEIKLFNAKVGDYVSYTATMQEQTVIDELNTEINSNSGTNDYTADTTKYKTTLTQQTPEWRVLEINETTGEPTKLISASTVGNMGLYRANGYNNAVYLLNKACDTLYSGEYGKARSINFKDIEDHLNDTGKAEKDGYSGGNVAYRETKKCSGYYANYPKIALEEKNMGINTIPLDENGKNPIREGGLGSNEQTEIHTGEDKAENGITVTQTYWNSNNISNIYTDLIYKELFHNAGKYWLASRCVNTSSNTCDFNVYYMGSTNIGAESIYNSNGATSVGNNGGIRPVIELNSNIKTNYKSESDGYITWDLNT